MQSRDFDYPPNWPKVGVIFGKARVEKVFKLRESETSSIFIAMSKKEVAALTSPTTRVIRLLRLHLEGLGKT